jgi:hypothetical protein
MLGALGVSAALLACPAPAMDPVGFSHSGRASDASVSKEHQGDGATDAPKPTLPEDARNAADQVGEAFPSGGHAGYRFQGTLFANAAARPLLEPGRREPPVGARLVMAHEEKQKGTWTSGPVFVMTRERDRWTYSAFDARGVKLPLEGHICDSCHTNSPNNGVFPIPLPVEGRKP